MLFQKKFGIILNMLNVFLFLCMACICVLVIFKKNNVIKKPESKFSKTLPYLVAGLFVLGILVRVLWFWEFPAGFNQDEASIGYDVFADINFGMDRNGYLNPVYSVAWGSGHSGLYIGLLNLSIRLLGLSVFSVRIINVIFGCIGLFAFYGVVRRLRGQKAAVIALFFMVINPWHIMMCRWGLECNLFPNVFLIGLYFLVRGEEKPFYYYVSLFFFALCLYAYGTSYMFIPVFLIIVSVYLFYHKKIKVRDFIISSVIFFLTAVPIIIFMLVNFFGMEEPNWGFISFPKLIDGRYNTTVTILNGSFFQNAFNNLITFIKLIIWQTDGLIFNAMPAFGTIYKFSLPFVLLGVFSLLRDKQNKGRMILFSMLPGILVLAMLSTLNINRANITFILLIYLASEGLFFVFEKSKKLFMPTVFVLFIAFGFFVSVYFTVYQPVVGTSFFDGFGEAIHQATEETDGKIYLTGHVNAPYIYALFYEEIDSRVFMETVEYQNPDSSVRFVNSFDRFVTGIPETPSAEDAAYVTMPFEAEKFDDNIFKKQTIGNFVVVIPLLSK